MDTARATGVSASQAGWIAKLIYRALRKRMGSVPRSKMLAAYHTGTLVATTWMDANCAPGRAVPLKLKELAQLKVAALVGCPY